MSALDRAWYPRANRGLGSQLLSASLLPAATAFGVGVRARNWLFDRGLLQAERVEGLFVISVGNVVLGGAGKTPAVIALCERLTAAGRRVAVLSRGYGRREAANLQVDPHGPAERFGDEPLLIARRCPQVEVFVGRRRVELARWARSRGAEVAILDDGLQHRRLARDLEIVVVDASSGFGNGRLFPAGPLREPPSALRRADLIWLRDAENRAPIAPAAHVFAEHRATELVTPAGVQPLSSLRGQRVFALCGVARPARFFEMLEQQGAELVDRAAFPDHHRFSSAELARVRERAQSQHLQLVTTEKDAVRLPAELGAWALRLSAVLADWKPLDERLRLVSSPALSAG